MGDEGSKLLESLMSSLGDNPAEKIGQMLSALTEQTESTQEDAKIKQESEPDLSLLGGLDLDMIMKIQGMMSAMNQNEQDDRDRLLTALKPFLSKERRPQVDRAIKLLKLSQLAKTAQEMDLFGKLL